MDSDLEDIKRRLSALEKQESPSVQPKSEKKKSEYQLHMSNRLKELKTEAESKGLEFDRRQAFSQAAREWTAKKSK
jgi:hypothetical protein